MFAVFEGKGGERASASAVIASVGSVGRRMPVALAVAIV